MKSYNMYQSMYQNVNECPDIVIVSVCVSYKKICWTMFLFFFLVNYEVVQIPNHSPLTNRSMFWKPPLRVGASFSKLKLTDDLGTFPSWMQNVLSSQNYKDDKLIFAFKYNLVFLIIWKGSIIFSWCLLSFWS